VLPRTISLVAGAPVFATEVWKLSLRFQDPYAELSVCAVACGCAIKCLPHRPGYSVSKMQNVGRIMVSKPRWGAGFDDMQNSEGVEWSVTALLSRGCCKTLRRE
jgi:hypothetical protein